MNYSHLFIGLVVFGWAMWVEWRLWANLRIHEETQKRAEKRSALHAVEK